jgi:hypothetical protein
MKLADLKNVKEPKEPSIKDNYELNDPNFNPKFQRVDSIELCADMINRPHEDYPKRVPRTKELIEYYTNGNDSQLMEFDIMQIHSFVMWDEAHRGRYRESEVTVGGWQPPNPLKVREYIKRNHVFPISRANDEYLIEWYRKFQMIHPFEDGNGRVGGIVVAVLSWDGKTLLAPLQ